MKRYSTCARRAPFLALALMFFCAFSLTVAAQPAWVKKVTKSVFTLKTFDADGNLLGSSCGVFVGEQGEAVSSYAPFRGASSAVVIDAAGKEFPVARMLGANETYDVAKFRVTVKKSQPVSIAAARQDEGSAAWLLPYREVKRVPQGAIRKVETIAGDYDYYTVALTMPDNCVCAPLLNEAGEVIGLMQQPYNAADTLSYAVSARYADSLKITGLSINDPALRATMIPKDLPTDMKQGLLSLYVGASTLPLADYSRMLNDFIRQFPQEQDGYIYRAQWRAEQGDFAAADGDMAEALRVAERPDEVHYSYSRMIFQKVVYRPDSVYQSWTLDRAMQEADEACRLNDQPAYRYQQATILYAQQRYADAALLYAQLAATPMRSASLFYEAAQCQAQLRDTTAQLALLDSAVAEFSKPYLKAAAPYLLARAEARMAAGKYRDAVLDLNDYEQLMAAQLTAQFYYLRHQAEIGGRLFQQALNDIDTAIRMEPQNEFLYAEKASLQVRVGLYEDAMTTGQALIDLRPELSDGYLFLGVAQCLAGQKQEGVKNLLRAKELGDEQAEGLIEKYSK